MGQGQRLPPASGRRTFACWREDRALSGVSAMPKPVRPLLLLGVCLWAACGSLRESAVEARLPPLHLRQLLSVQTGEGDRALLFRLSRPGAGLRHGLSRDGNRIEIEVFGAGGEDFPEREVEQSDPQIRSVRVAKKGQTLRLTVELRSQLVAGYEVQEMADWILIRFPSGNSRG